MKSLSIAASLTIAVSAVHEGHDYSSLKPAGVYYGILTKTNAKGDKNWNNMEVQFDFGDSTFNMQWWFGMQVPMIDVEKQVFICDNIPYTFDQSRLIVEMNPESNACLQAVNANFPANLGLSDPYFLPVDQDSGDIEFKLAAGMIRVDMFPIDAPVAVIPSGQNGLAPEQTPARRSGVVPEKPCCSKKSDSENSSAASSADEMNTSDIAQPSLSEGLKVTAIEAAEANGPFSSLTVFKTLCVSLIMVAMIF